MLPTIVHLPLGLSLAHADETRERECRAGGGEGQDGARGEDLHCSERVSSYGSVRTVIRLQRY